jgi:hypothetical protein
MRIAFILLIGIHGLIHLFGFLKAFHLSEFNSILQPISKTLGLIWLLAFVLFSITAILVLIHSDYWWVTGFVAVIISQVLVLTYWSDAKFGSLPNIIILFLTIIGYATFSFKEKIRLEQIALFKDAQVQKQRMITPQELIGLPSIVKQWLTHSGIIGTRFVSNVHLNQELELQLKPEQTDWKSGTAEQYFTVQPPAFNWTIETEINPILPIVGRDKFVNGKGEMLIKLLALIPVANAKDDSRINEATLQRYLAEIVWFPSAALSPYITWESVDEYSARAIMDYQGTKGSGVFYFDSTGTFKKFVTMRFRDSKDQQPTEWTVTASKTEVRNGIQIPVECEASWKLGNDYWTWLKLRLKQIEYDLKEIPTTKDDI